MAIKDGQLASADEVMNAIASNFVDNAQNLFNADYIGFDSRLSNTGAPSLKNVFYSTFQTDDADINYGFIYDSTNDLYQLPDLSSVSYYVVIEATSYSGTLGTNVIQIDSGKWLVFDSTLDASQEVQRALVHKALWVQGTESADNWTSITALKVSDSDDTGMQGNYMTGSFSGGGSGAGGNTSTWEMPTNTILNTQSNEIGTDQSADEKVDPATCRAEGLYNSAIILQIDGVPSDQSGNTISSWSNVSANNSNDATCSVITFCQGNIAWTANSGSIGIDIDYFVDYSVPLSTLAGSLSAEGAGNGTLIFKDTASASVTNAIAVINSTIDATSSEQISISADGGSNYTNVNNAEIARPTAGTALWRRIVITRTDTSKTDIVTEQAVKYELY